MTVQQSTNGCHSKLWPKVYSLVDPLKSWMAEYGEIPFSSFDEDRIRAWAASVDWKTWKAFANKRIQKGWDILNKFGFRRRVCDQTFFWYLLQFLGVVSPAIKLWEPKKFDPIDHFIPERSENWFIEFQLVRLNMLIPFNHCRLNQAPVFESLHKDCWFNEKRLDNEHRRSLVMH